MHAPAVANINLHTKSEVPSFTNSKMKSGSRDPEHTHPDMRDDLPFSD